MSNQQQKTMWERIEDLERAEHEKAMRQQNTNPKAEAQNPKAQPQPQED